MRIIQYITPATRAEPATAPTAIPAFFPVEKPWPEKGAVGSGNVDPEEGVGSGVFDGKTVAV